METIYPWEIIVVCCQSLNIEHLYIVYKYMCIKHLYTFTNGGLALCSFDAFLQVVQHMEMEKQTLLQIDEYFVDNTFPDVLRWLTSVKENF